MNARCLLVLLWLPIAANAGTQASADGRSGAAPVISVPAFQDRTLEKVAPGDALRFAAGNGISFCPTLSCLTVPSGDHQRTSALFAAMARADSAAEEQTVAIHTAVTGGELHAMRRSASYAYGANAYAGTAVYRAIRAGTTAATGGPPLERPSTSPFIVTDGTVRWLWINDQAIAAKLGLYNEIVAQAGGGNTWGQANNLELQTGWRSDFAANLELDLTNASGRTCLVGTTNCLGLYIRVSGRDRSTSALQVESSGGGLFFGARMVGPMDTGLSLDATGARAIGIGTVTPARYDVAAIDDASTAPAGLNITGTKSIAGIRDASTAPVGLRLDGTYAQFQIAGSRGFSVRVDGAVQAPQFNRPHQTPASSSAACITGDEVADANYIYRCVAPNSWKRATLSAW
jgi:hypothetical protein